MKPNPKPYPNPNEVDRFSQDNSAIEAPLANVRSDFNPSIVPKERQDNHELEKRSEFFDLENTALRKWAPSGLFRAFLEKNLKRRLTVDQVNEIIGEN